ncbi:MAG TPA: tetratricopeptide repeat protein [Ktedonobacteraceae bacterium]|nr:tetratricopeptide repeat protein [Ktedonobacteraceae bacterium]
MKPNSLLKRERELRGWSQAKVAEGVGTTALNVGRWERGVSMPYPHFREKLCLLFGKDAAALGLLEAEEETFVSPSLRSPSGSLAGEAIVDPAIPLPPPGQVRLIGRDDLVKNLRSRLCGEAKPVTLALNGLPGVGKTALAIELAYDAELRGHFPDGILWAGLGVRPDITELLSRWGALLGISVGEIGKETSSEAWARAIRSTIGWRQMLLVIDDAWEIEDALAFQVGGPCCAYMVTTRYPHLAVQLAADGAQAIPELTEQDGLALLARYAGEFVERAPEMASALVRSVGALPLAITLMGKYLSVQVYSGQPRRLNAAVEHLRDARARLQLSEARTLAERHPSLASGTSLSLQSVIAVSEQLLTEDARSALRALSIFPAKPNSFSEEAALEVSQASVETLDALCDSGLLESNGPSRYMLHQTISDYARASFTDPVVSERLANYYVRFVEKHQNEHELLEIETSNVLAAFDSANLAGRCGEIARGVCAFAPFLLMRGLYALAERHLKRAYTAARSIGDIRRIIETLKHLSLVELAAGSIAEAGTILQEGLKLAKEAGYEEQVCDLLRNLGMVEGERGNPDQSEGYFQEGLELARRLNLQEQICRLLTGLGVVAGRRGKYGQGLHYFQEALQLARGLDHRERIATLLLNLGWLEDERGHYAQAETYYVDCLNMARQHGYDELQGAVQVNLSTLMLSMGRYASGQTYLSQALTLLRQVGNYLWIAQAFQSQGELAAAQGNDVQAERAFREGLAIARRLDHREQIGTHLTSLGELEIRRGNLEQAERYLREALILSKELARMILTCLTCYAYGNLCLHLQHIEEAEDYFLEMQRTAPPEHRELQALALFGLARVAFVRNQQSQARRYGKASLSIFTAIGNRRAIELENWLRLTERDAVPKTEF